MIRLSNTKRDLRLAWLPGELPDYPIGTHVQAHWEDMPDGTARLHLEKAPAGPTVNKVRASSEELSVRWQLDVTSAPKFGQTDVSLHASGVIFVPKDRAIYVPKRRTANATASLATAAVKAATAVTVDGLRSSLRTAVDCINTAKQTLGDDLNLVVQSDGSLKIMLMMEI